jgi:DNA-binding PadR family transcriptional regulator
MHGFALSKWIDDRTDGELGIVDSALYKALHRLEDSGAGRASGARRRTIAARSTTRSHRRDDRCSVPRSRRGSALSRPSPQP